MGLEAIALIGVAATIASTGISVYSGIQQSKGQEALARYNQQVEENNAKQAQQEGEAAASQQRRSNARVLARIRAQQGHAGNFGTGSAIESLADTAAQLELDALDIERQGHIAKSAAEARANIHGIQASSAKRSRPLVAGATALSGFGRSLSIAQGL